MKCNILHESPGQLRVHLHCARMTLHQADVLEYYLRSIDGVKEVKVYDRTQDAVVLYTAPRGMIPLDGKVVSGEAMVNQSSMTGESMPVPKRPGSYVYAGTVAEEGECVICVDKASGGGRYDRIVHMIEESEKLKSTANILVMLRVSR